MAAQRGRPKVVRDEGPTPETARKHLERAERYRIPAHIEPGFAETTFGILHARGMIGVDQYELCKKLASLRDILWGTGQPKCSSIENASRGLPNDRETKYMRETWTAYKAATAELPNGDRHLFEHVILRNNTREWMRWSDSELFIRIAPPSVPPTEGDNVCHGAGGKEHVFGRVREASTILRVILLLSERMPREMKAGVPAGEFTSLSQAQRNALDGGTALLDKLYAGKGTRA